MGIIIATLIVVVAIASALAQDFAIFSWDYWLEGGNALRSEVVRNLGLLAAAVIGLVVGSWRAVLGYMQAKASQQQAAAANEQAGIAQRGQITERFSRAVEQLGHDRVAVRIGGLYALKRIGEDSVERDHLAVMDVLTNFIRQPPYTNERRANAERARKLMAGMTINVAAGDTTESELIDCPDIVAAIEIIQYRSEDQRELEAECGYRLSLSRANLSYFQLPGVDLRYFDLAGANLTSANLIKADLTGADLTGANLTNAKLTDADLSGADLTGANLSGTKLTLANLKNANLTSANLSGADLTRADLEDANLTDAYLARANNLTQDQLDTACINKGGKPPDLHGGLKPPQKECVPRPQ